MSITVIKPGLLSSFQDLGRHGHQHLGVPVGGAMDVRAHRLANLLAGNDEDQASLEITLKGPQLRFDAASCIAISGADLAPALNQQPIPNNRPVIVQAGDVLTFGTRRRGLRAYLAVHGGFCLPCVLGSRSTYMRGTLGGLQGRSLRANDRLALNQALDSTQAPALSEALWKIKVYLPALLGNTHRRDVRIIAGPHADRFTPESWQQLLSADWRVAAQSERMGYRLDGPVLNLADTRQLLSEGTSFGTIQVPADGQPIILMADRQTTGGYARIAHVATVDLPVIAQTMPGEHLRFRDISLGEAQQLDHEREAAFERLFRGVADIRTLLGDAARDVVPRSELP